uniref:Uncharacterized protein n=1 Tax=Timema shepardi TaxID=629360 RepID=A0A7R9B3C7_TIMSH|nr:unnamed protein product [Timema shepardi]
MVSHCITGSYQVWDIRHLGGRAVGFTVDVSDRKEVLETAIKVILEVGHITMLVNNVGIYPVKPVIEWNLEELTELIHTNFFSHFWTLQAFLPNMIELNKGHVVAISSAAAIAPVMNEVPYSASKSAVSDEMHPRFHGVWKNHPQCTQLGLNPDLPIFGSLIQQKSSTLDHVATKVGLLDGLLHELRRNSNNNIKITTVHPYYTCTRTDLPVKFDLSVLSSASTCSAVCPFPFLLCVVGCTWPHHAWRVELHGSSTHSGFRLMSMRVGCSRAVGSRFWAC